MTRLVPYLRRITTTLVVLVGAGSMSVFALPGASVAATFSTTIGDSYWCPYNYSTQTTDPPNCDQVEVDITLPNGTTYLPGASVAVTGTMRLLNTAHAGTNNMLTYYSSGFTWELVSHQYSITTTLNGTTKTLFDLPYGSGSWDPVGNGSCKMTGGCPPSGSATFTAPTTPGTYYLTCNALISQEMNDVTLPDLTASIPPTTCKVAYTVVSTAQPNLIAGPINENTAVAGAGKVFSVLITNDDAASTTSAFYNLLQRATGYNAATGVASGVSDVGNKVLSTRLGPSVPSTTLLFNSYAVPAADAGTVKYFRACADRSTGAGANQLVTESDENDNCGNWTPVQITSAPQADITALSTQASNASPTTGTAVSFVAQVKNIGTASAGPVPNAFKLSFNAAKSAPYAWLAATQVSTLAVPNGIANIVSSGSYSTTSPGTYYVQACGNYTTSGTPLAGSLNTAFSESSTANNCDTSWKAVTVSLPPQAGKPNLRVTDLLNEPRTAVVGQVQDYSVTVRNTSTDTGVAEPFYNLLQKTNSIDASGNPTGTVWDVTPAYTSTDVLASGQATITVPAIASTWIASDAGTTRYLRICADKSAASDVDGSIAESDTEDNCGDWTPIAVSAPPPPKPNLTAGNVYWTGGDAVVGTARTYRALISNAAASTGVSFYNKFQVASGPQGSGTITSYTTAIMGPLSAGGTGTLLRNQTFTAWGTYSVRACADSNASGTTWVAESNEGDNCGSNWVDVKACMPNAGTACQSAPNECGVSASGVFACDGTCSAEPVACSLPPDVELTAYPLRVPKNSPTVLNWSGTNTPTSCSLRRFVAGVETIGGGWPVTSSVLNGTVRSGSTSTPVTAQTVYTARCDNDVNFDEASVTVNIFPDFTEF